MNFSHRLFILSALVASAPAWAVKVSECPERITVDFEKITPMSDAALARQETDVFTASCGVEDVTPARDELASHLNPALNHIELNLQSAANSVCVYQGPANGRLAPHYPGQENPNDDGAAETRLFNRGGKNLLRIAYLSGDSIVWSYLTVTKYAKDEGIEVKPAKGIAVSALFDHGSPHCTIGWASGIQAK